MPAIHNLENLDRLSAEEIVALALAQQSQAAACLTCSFQAEDILVLHLFRERLPRIPVLFLETGYHFKQTYEFRDRLAHEWNLNIVNVMPEKTVDQQESDLGILYREDSRRCCQLRKVEPLMRVLQPYDVWFTGLRREQSPSRINLKKAEQHQLPSGKHLLKVSPLADWSWAQVWEYTSSHDLPYLPLYDCGYLSIGCEPCTALPSDPDNPRSGRWGGTKLECGIHTFSERSQ